MTLVDEYRSSHYMIQSTQDPNSPTTVTAGESTLTPILCFVTIPTSDRPPISDKLVSVGEIRIDCDDVLKYLAPAW